jgi:hypothetical protein
MNIPFMSLERIRKISDRTSQLDRLIMNAIFTQAMNIIHMAAKLRQDGTIVHTPGFLNDVGVVEAKHVEALSRILSKLGYKVTWPITSQDTFKILVRWR